MATIDKADSSFAHNKPNPADIDMTKVDYFHQMIGAKFDLVSSVPLMFRLFKVYDSMTFDNPDGGVWKQGWEVS